MKITELITFVALFATVALLRHPASGQDAATNPPASKSSTEEAKKAEDSKKVEEPKSEEEKKSWISGTVGTAITNEYIFIGLVQDKDTVIVQPYVNLSFSLYEGEGTINALRFELPLWWSIHDINKPRPLNGNSSLKDWFEFDVSPGFSFTIAKKWTFTISDYIYTSPGDYFDTSHNLNLALSYDDSDLLGAFAMNPHVYFLQELDNHSGLGTKGDTLSQYYEIGIAPSHVFGEKSTYPVTLSFPTAAGFGTNGYYGQGFGYFNTGAMVSVPLAFIPSTYGSWTASVMGQYWRLGTDPARFTDNPNNTSTGRRNQGVVSWSIGTEF